MNDSALNIPASQKEISSKDVRLADGKADEWKSLTQRIAEHGDQQAFAEYYNVFFETMFATVKRTTGCDEATCLDIVQDAMVKAIKKMKVLETRTKTEAWTRTVAKTTAFDYLRRQSRRRKLVERLSEVIAKPRQEEIDASARLIWVEEQLQQLPTELRSMIGLKYRMGWTLQQIGQRFGLKSGAVDGKIRRAIKNLNQRASREFDNE